MSIQSNINQMMNTIALASFGYGQNLKRYQANVAEQQKEQIARGHAEKYKSGVDDPASHTEKYLNYEMDRLDRGLPLAEKDNLTALMHYTPGEIAQAMKVSKANADQAMRQQEIIDQRQATIDNLLKARQNIEKYERSEK